MHNSEYHLSDSYRALSEFARQSTAVSMDMQQAQTIRLWKWMQCDDIQDNTKVSRFWFYYAVYNQIILGVVFTRLAGQFCACRRLHIY